jgi:hypothetical protein
MYTDKVASQILKVAKTQSIFLLSLYGQKKRSIIFSVQQLPNGHFSVPFLLKSDD